MKRVRPFKVGNEKVSYLWNGYGKGLSNFEWLWWMPVAWWGENFGGCERTAANPLEAQTTYQNKQILILYKSI